MFPPEPLEIAQITTTADRARPDARDGSAKYAS
jgi:hypothetical protein